MSNESIERKKAAAASAPEVVADKLLDAASGGGDTSMLTEKTRPLQVGPAPASKEIVSDSGPTTQI